MQPVRCLFSHSFTDLIKDKYTFGHNADIVLDRERIPEGVLKKCSKNHFLIERQQINVMGALTTRVVLIDTSSNGTFINGHILKKRAGVQKKKVLASNDVIGLPAGKPSPIYEGSAVLHIHFLPIYIA